MRTQTVLGNWARDSRSSQYDTEIDREIERIEDDIRHGDENLLRKGCGDIRGGLVRLVELQKPGSPTVRPRASVIVHLTHQRGRRDLLPKEAGRSMAAWSGGCGPIESLQLQPSGAPGRFGLSE